MLPLVIFANRVIVSLSYRRIPVLSWIARKLQYMDDFDWNAYAYSADYHSEIGPFGSDFKSAFSTKLSDIDYHLDSVSGEIYFDGKPVLYPTHELIITTSVKLKPASIFEFGYGSGPHLLNLRTALPSARLGGADISDQMREQAIASCPENSTEQITFLVRDLTDPAGSEDLQNTYELVYCHQVLLHIHRKGAAENFLRNMAAISTRYIMLVEDFNRHDLCRMINKVFPQTKIYVIDSKYATAILIDKKNAVDMRQVKTDTALRLIDLQAERRFKEFLSAFQEE